MHELDLVKVCLKCFRPKEYKYDKIDDLYDEVESRRECPSPLKRLSQVAASPLKRLSQDAASKVRRVRICPLPLKRRMQRLSQVATSPVRRVRRIFFIDDEEITTDSSEIYQVNLHAQDKGGWHPIHVAAFSGNIDAVTLLLPDEYLSDMSVDDVKKNVDASDNNGSTPLNYACEVGNLPIVKLLIDRGADPTKKNDVDGQTPLHRAAAFGHVEIVDYLRSLFNSKGRPEWIEAADNSKLTPHDYASLFGHTNVCNLLLDENYRSIEVVQASVAWWLDPS